MQLGVVILPDERWSIARESWRRAEALGFAHAWTYDHMSWRTLRDRTWLAMVPTLAAAASVTTTIRLGPLVASPNFRHPALFAKELVALDDISGGRIIAGIGAGGTGFDATVLGGSAPTPAERASRFHEFVEATDLFLREPAASYDGKVYEAEEVRTFPGCVQQPRLPLAIAATGAKGIALAARYGDYWVTNGDTGSMRPQLELLDEACREAHRDPSSIRRLLLTDTELDPQQHSVESFAEAVEGYEALGLTDLVVHWPRSEEPYQGDADHFEKVVAPVLARQ